MKLKNDNSCSWINDLNKKDLILKLLKKSKMNGFFNYWSFRLYRFISCKKIRSISKSKNNIVDAHQKIFSSIEGASSRNSGYLVDTTLNDGFTSNKELENYKKKSDIYKLGIDAIKRFVKEYQVDCDWNECGKYFASSSLKIKIS